LALRNTSCSMFSARRRVLLSEHVSPTIRIRYELMMTLFSQIRIDYSDHYSAPKRIRIEYSVHPLLVLIPRAGLSNSAALFQLSSPPFSTFPHSHPPSVPLPPFRLPPPPRPEAATLPSFSLFPLPLLLFLFRPSFPLEV